MGEMRAVKTVDFSGRNLGDEGVTALSTGLAFNNTAKEINFASNQITAVGMVPLCDAFNTNFTMEKLNLEGNGFGDEGAKILGKILEVGQSSLFSSSLFLFHRSSKPVPFVPSVQSSISISISICISISIRCPQAADRWSTEAKLLSTHSLILAFLQIRVAP